MAALAFSQPASPRMIFQQSWRSSHICWALVGCFFFTLWSYSSQTISIGLRSGDCGGQVICCSTLSLSFLVIHCPAEKHIFGIRHVGFWTRVNLYMDFSRVHFSVRHVVSELFTWYYTFHMWFCNCRDKNLGLTLDKPTSWPFDQMANMWNAFQLIGAPGKRLDTPTHSLFLLFSM